MNNLKGAVAYFYTASDPCLIIDQNWDHIIAIYPIGRGKQEYVYNFAELKIITDIFI